MFFQPTDNHSFSKLDTSQYTLVLPAICVGNVGQLTVDVLIATTSAEHVGSIYDGSLLPVIGNDPFSDLNTATSCKLSTCCDVYCARSARLMIVQQRASFVKGKRKQFRNNLINWIKERRFSRVYLISSTFSQIRTDQQITGSQFRYLATEEATSTITMNPQWIELEDSPDEFNRMSKHMPGSGIAKTLYHDCLHEKIPFVVLLTFCSEGDNAPDAVRMATYANEWINIGNQEGQMAAKNINWKIPQSWNLNFGSRHSNLIY